MKDDKKYNMDKEQDVPMHLQAKMDVVKALQKLAKDMMAEDADGDDSDDSPEGIIAKVDVKKIQPDELNDGSGKMTRLDAMTQEENDHPEIGGESMDHEDEEEDKSLIEKMLKKHNR